MKYREKKTNNKNIFTARLAKFRVSQVFLDPIKNCVSPRSALLEAVYLEALLYLHLEYLTYSKKCLTPLWNLKASFRRPGPYLSQDHRFHWANCGHYSDSWMALFYFSMSHSVTYWQEFVSYGILNIWKECLRNLPTHSFVLDRTTVKNKTCACMNCLRLN